MRVQLEATIQVLDRLFGSSEPLLMVAESRHGCDKTFPQALPGRNCPWLHPLLRKKWAAIQCQCLQKFSRLSPNPSIGLSAVRSSDSLLKGTHIDPTTRGIQRHSAMIEMHDSLNREIFAKTLECFGKRRDGSIPVTLRPQLINEK